MKVLALTIATLVMFTNARADEIDFKAIKCATYLQKVQERNLEAPGSNSELKNALNTVHLWLHGYASAKTGATTLPETPGNFALELVNQCAATPQKDLAQTAEDAMRALSEKP
jgi:hypothetical protein